MHCKYVCTHVSTMTALVVSFPLKTKNIHVYFHKYCTGICNAVQQHVVENT